MYKVHFYNRVEVRMGSPYNVADIDIEGDFVPIFDGFDFQDKVALSKDRSICFLVQWSIQNNEPGFILWKLSEEEQSVVHSERFEGCCDDIKLVKGKLEVTFTNGSKTSVKVVDFLKG